MKLKVWCEDIRARLPVRAHATDAGIDLYSVTTKTLRQGDSYAFETGIRIALPAGHEGQVRPRSGLAFKHDITVVNAPGTIDEGYRGPVKVKLINLGKAPVLISEGDRIAQLVVTPVSYCGVERVESEGALGTTERGEEGFGSTDRQPIDQESDHSHEETRDSEFPSAE